MVSVKLRQATTFVSGAGSLKAVLVDEQKYGNILGPNNRHNGVSRATENNSKVVLTRSSTAELNHATNCNNKEQSWWQAGGPQASSDTFTRYDPKRTRSTHDYTAAGTRIVCVVLIAMHQP